MEEKPNYYAIIPANVRYDESLSYAQRLLYGEIVALSSKDGYCYATNNYFASLYKVSNISISNWINKLVKKGYLQSEIIYKDNTKEVLYRRLTPIKEIFNTPIKENFNTLLKKSLIPIKENFKDNNINKNNINNNNIYIVRNEDKIPYKEIVEYLNEKANTKYRYTSENTKKHIKARFNDGYTIDDFKKVIDIKTKEWLKTNMEKYLRPETLFGSKFENYVNQKEKKSIKQLLDEL